MTIGEDLRARFGGSRPPAVVGEQAVVDMERRGDTYAVPGDNPRQGFGQRLRERLAREARDENTLVGAMEKQKHEAEMGREGESASEKIAGKVGHDLGEKWGEFKNRAFHKKTQKEIDEARLEQEKDWTHREKKAKLEEQRAATSLAREQLKLMQDRKRGAESAANAGMDASGLSLFGKMNFLSGFPPTDIYGNQPGAHFGVGIGLGGNPGAYDDVDIFGWQKSGVIGGGNDTSYFGGNIGGGLSLEGFGIGSMGGLGGLEGFSLGNLTRGGFGLEGWNIGGASKGNGFGIEGFGMKNMFDAKGISGGDYTAFQMPSFNFDFGFGQPKNGKPGFGMNFDIFKW